MELFLNHIGTQHWPDISTFFDGLFRRDFGMAVNVYMQLENRKQ